MTNQDILDFLSSQKVEGHRIADLASHIEGLSAPIVKLEPCGGTDTGLFLSGSSCDGAPTDKHGSAMILFGQLDFSELPGCLQDTDSKLPAAGFLRVFLSPNYKQFRPKESGWFKSLLAFDSVASAKRVFEMKASMTVYVPTDFAENRSQPDHNPPYENRLNSGVNGIINSFNEHFVGTDYILGEPDQAAMEARVIAAFHANGISYDDKRRNDSCYSHLVEDAASWRVLWKSGHVCLVFPEEKRELYICIRCDDLQNGDYSKCFPVLL